ncbi:MAG: hypothetical protein M3R24_23995 [Chloroflexota bacterium]|nr:hypothetical protein [Chloroflexota bacterium]
MSDYSSPLKYAPGWMWLWIVLGGLIGGSLAVLGVVLFGGQMQAAIQGITCGLIPGVIYFAGGRFRPNDLPHQQLTHKTLIMLLGLYIVIVGIAMGILLLTHSPSVERYAYTLFTFVGSSIGAIIPPFWYEWQHTRTCPCAG